MLKITRTWSTFLVDFLQDFPHHRISGNQSSLSESDLPGPQLTVVAQTDLCFWKLDSSTYENLWTNTILRGFSIFGKFTILRGFSIFGKFTILRGFSIFWKNVYIYIQAKSPFRIRSTMINDYSSKIAHAQTMNFTHRIHRSEKMPSLAVMEGIVTPAWLILDMQKLMISQVWHIPLWPGTKVFQGWKFPVSRYWDWDQSCT